MDKWRVVEFDGRAVVAQVQLVIDELDLGAIARNLAETKCRFIVNSDTNTALLYAPSFAEASRQMRFLVQPTARSGKT